MDTTRRWSAIAAVATSLGLAAFGCGHGTLVPASSANLVPNAPTAAFSVVQGVRCSANAGAWMGRELPEFVIPIKVRITNTSGRPIRVLYEDFVLQGKKGRSYRPIPVLPLDAEPRAQITKLDPIYSSAKFYVAPAFSDVYTELDAWSAPLPRDADLHDTLFRRWRGKTPGGEVLRMALPEGVLDDGGVVTGFLFFESPLEKESRVTLAADFAAGDGQSTVASIEIPFTVK
jgi:hypothetical protein